MLQNALVYKVKGMEIRFATPDDYASVIEMEAEIQTQHAEGAPFMFPPTGVLSPEAYLELLARPDEKMLVAVEGDELVGYLHYELINRPASYYTYAEKLLHVHVLTVKGTQRRKGYGEALIDHAVERAREHGASRVTLEVYSFNEGAVRFYERIGFAPIKQVMSMTLPNGSR